MGSDLKPGHRSHDALTQIGKLVLLVGGTGILLIEFPNGIGDPTDGGFLMIVGGLAVWRYTWWFTHFVRSRIYALVLFPRLRSSAQQIWNDGWRPRMLHFMMVTFRERRETTEAVLSSIVQECRRTQVPARLFIGTGDPFDESIIEEYFATHAIDVDLNVVIVRQNQPGKRFAIGLVLRALSRHGVEKEDLVVFMDGDSIIQEGLMEKCAPIFSARPRLGALTTNEIAIVSGPRWMQSWHDLRFAQRRLVMESHSVSRKVLTLTGRLSIFRGEIAVNGDFIRTIECDNLEHWLWGKCRFLSGDDKSTWYWVLKNQYEMLYVPDAFCTTIENIAVNPYFRLQQNLLRWSGNMLRNGTRAILLGPRRVGLFIWWCLIDQRIAMWTVLTGPILAVLLTLVRGPQILLAYLIWVLATRLVLSSVLFFYARGVYISFPVLLFLNQIATSVIKVHLLFRMSKQRWLNRGDQRVSAGAANMLAFQRFMAGFITVFYVALLIFAIAVYSGVLQLPRWESAIGWLLRA